MGFFLNHAHGLLTTLSRVLVEVLELYQCVSISTGEDHSDVIFVIFDELLRAGSDPVKETTVVILGLAGKCVMHLSSQVEIVTICL